MGELNHIAVAVDAIIIKEDKILLVKRENNPFKNHWALPGGFVNIGESVEEAVLREIEEETSLTASITKLIGLYSKPNRDPRGHVISIVFSMKANGTPKAGDDASKTIYFSKEEIQGLDIAFDHKDIIFDYWSKH